jgi:hypothetical protein
MRNAFAPLNSEIRETNSYLLGPGNAVVEGGFDFVITPDTLVMEDIYDMTVLSCNYTLRNSDEVSGSLFLARKTDTPYILLMYSVVEPGVEVDTARKNVLGELGNGNVAWSEME